MTTRLYRTGKFEVIERQLLDKIVQEQKIALSGMVDESSAVELGRVLGVDAIASGTIGDLGTSVKVNARLEDKSVICKLGVTNTTEEDKEFEVTLGWQYKTMIYTDTGDESVFTKIKIGEKMHKIYGTSQYDAVTKKVFPGTTVIMEIYFENVSSKATRIDMLQILSKYRNGFQIEFRDIPLKRN